MKKEKKLDSEYAENQKICGCNYQEEGLTSTKRLAGRTLLDEV